MMFFLHHGVIRASFEARGSALVSRVVALPTCDGTSFFKAVNYPSSDPLVTGVGGTSLTAS